MTRTGKCRQLSYCEINNDRRRWWNLQVSQGTSLWLPVLHNDFSDIALQGTMYMIALKRASVTGLWAAKTFIGGKLRYHVTVLVLHSWVTAKERRSLVHCYKRMVSARVLCVQCTMVFGYAVHFCVWCRHARDYERRQRAMFSSFCVFTCDRQLRHTLTLVSCQVLVWHSFGPYAYFISGTHSNRMCLRSY